MTNTICWLIALAATAILVAVFSGRATDELWRQRAVEAGCGELLQETGDE